MTERWRMTTLILVMILVAIGVGGTTMWGLYQAEVREESEHLSIMAQAQVNFIEGVLKTESAVAGRIDQEKALALIRDCYKDFNGFGRTGEFVIARRTGEMMQFIVHQHRENKKRASGLPFSTRHAEPMRRALLGQRGVMFFDDCEGRESIAAYEPIGKLGLALVTRISLSELRAPFFQATRQLSFIGSLMVLLGTSLFWWITRPLLSQLKSKELRYRTLFENTADAVFLMRGRSIIETNGQASTMLGAQQQDIIGQSPVFFAPEFQADGRSSLAAAHHYIQEAMCGMPQSFTWQYLRKDQLREAEIVLQALTLDGDDVVLATMRDVTDIKIAERSLRERERHYRAIFERGSNGFLLYRRDGQLVDANPAACRMYGYEREELLSLTLGERVHADDAVSYLECVDQTITLDQGCHRELRGLDRNGNLIHFEVFLESFSWRGEMLCLATAIDVSERKKAEKSAQCEEMRMEALLTLQQMLEFTEPQICRYVLGPATLISESRGAFLAVADADGELKVQASTLELTECWIARQLGVAKSRLPLICNHPDSYEVNAGLAYQRYLQVPLLEDGQIVAVVGLIDKEQNYSDFDVRQLLLLLQGTWQRLQRNRAIVALKQAKDEAEDANRAKSEFLAIVSHEIRTPMTVTMAAIQQVLDTPLQPLQKQYLTMADDASNSLLQLINDILDFSKIEARKLELELEPFSVRECVENIVTILGVNAQQKGLGLKAMCDDNVPDLLLGDQHRLRQILVNLVGNALKFTETGEVRVIVYAENVVAGRCDVTMEVCDTGIGIAEEQYDQLFECFKQADSSTTRKYGGTGLGLAICKGLVEQMGGTIGVENQNEGGCCFKFMLPLQSVTRQGYQIDHDPKLRTDADPQMKLPGMQVLLVEDDPAEATLITALLERFGLQVVHVVNGAVAVERCREGGFDLVLMAYQLPQLDGMNATAQIRAAGFNVPIVGLTAHDSHDGPSLCMAAGMDGCLVKPVDQECLQSILLRFSPVV